MKLILFFLSFSAFAQTFPIRVVTQDRLIQNIFRGWNGRIRDTFRETTPEPIDDNTIRFLSRSDKRYALIRYEAFETEGLLNEYIHFMNDYEKWGSIILKRSLEDNPEPLGLMKLLRFNGIQQGRFPLPSQYNYYEINLTMFKTTLYFKENNSQKQGKIDYGPHRAMIHLNQADLPDLKENSIWYECSQCSGNRIFTQLTRTGNLWQTHYYKGDVNKDNRILPIDFLNEQNGYLMGVYPTFAGYLQRVQNFFLLD